MALGPPTTTMGTVTSADSVTGVYGMAYGGAIFEAADPGGIGPAVGARVLFDYLPSSGQWIIVGIIT